MDFIIKTFRILFFMLDEVIYGLIDDFYALLLQLCRTSIFTQDVISEFAKRVYALVGIFMLFKVTLSIITYILNPEDFSDKEKGFTSIIKHVILSLVLVVITPYIFSEAYDLQTIILEDNTIMNVVFGTPAEAHMPNTSYVESAGNKIQFTIMYAFAQPNIDDFYTDSNTNLASCATTYKKDSNGNYEFRALPKYDIEVASACEAGKSCFIYELNPDCFGSYNADNDTYENGPLYNAFNEYESEDSIAGSTVYQNYAQGVAQQNFNMFFRKDIILATVDTDGTKRYIIDYKFGISTAVGVGVLYLLLLFCIDIAVRSVKLGFLQMIAPVPIISYCDPKSKKDGMFSKWLKMCVSTYLELFFRLFALYFGIYVISLIGTFKDVITNQKVDGFFVSVFMIIGILIFIKQLPKILEDGLGIKGSGKFQLNPFKKLEDEAFGYKQIRGVASAGLAGAAAFGAGFIGSKNGHRLGGALRAGFGATGRGLVGAAKGEKFGKNFSNSYSGAMQAKLARDDRIDDNVGWAEMQKAKFQQAIGMHTKGEAVKTANDSIKKLQDTYKGMQNAAIGNDTNTFSASRYGAAYAKYGDFKGIKGLEKYIDEVKKTNISRDAYATEADYLNAVTEQQQRIADLEDIRDKRLNNIASGVDSTGDVHTDRAITEGYKTMQSLVKDINSSTHSFDSGIGSINASADAKTINGQSKGVSSQISGSTAANHATTVDQYAQRKGQK